MKIQRDDIPSSLLQTIRDIRVIRGSMLPSQHQGHELAAACDFEFPEDRMEMFFHHRQTQTRRVRDFLVALSIANKTRDFLLTSG